MYYGSPTSGCNLRGSPSVSAPSPSATQRFEVVCFKQTAVTKLRWFVRAKDFYLSNKTKFEPTQTLVTGVDCPQFESVREQESVVVHASLGPARSSACLATVSQRCAGWQTVSSPTSGRQVGPRRPNTHVGFYTTFVSHYNVHVFKSKR